MNTTRAVIFFLFWIALIADCFLIFTNHPQSRIYTKPLLAPLLMVVIYIEGRHTKHVPSKILMTVALFFCFLGDFSLLNESDSGHFTFGLVSFLIAHLFFSFFFYHLRSFKSRHILFLIANAAIITAYISLLLFLIWRSISLQNFQIPVVVYSIVLGFMLFCALNTSKNRSIKHLSL